MRIKSIPEEYTGTLTPVIYEIDQVEPSQTINIGIIGSNDNSIIGEKRLAGESSYTINTANYCGREIVIEPAPGKWTGFGKDAQRCSVSKIIVGEEMSQPTVVAGGAKTCPQKTILSDSPVQHTIACGETDEIAIIAPGSQISAKTVLVGNGNISEEINLGNIVCEDGVYLLVIDTAYIDSCLDGELEAYNIMKVQIADGSDILGNRNYRLVPASANSLRLCWQNPYGQIDYHTFRLTGETIGIDKSRAYVAEGYATTAITQDTTRYAISECLPKATLKWLSQIIAAPKVWVAENGTFTNADVLTDRLQMQSEYPEAIGIAVRNAKRLTIKQA